MTYARFPKIIKIVFDHRGLGDAFPQFMSQPWISPEGKEYPPFVLDDERSLIHNAVPLLRSVKGNVQVNQQMVSCLRIALEHRSIVMPLSSRTIHEGRVDTGDDEDSDEAAPKRKALTAQEKAIFLEADALQIEMGNIVMRVSTGGSYTYDVARAKQHKDRYSSLAMAVRFISELEEGRKRLLAGRMGGCIGVVSKM